MLAKLNAFFKIAAAVSAAAMAGCATLAVDNVPLTDPRYRAERKLEAFGTREKAIAYINASKKVNTEPARPGEDEEIVVSGLRGTLEESITNNQEGGVDEGDIIKLSGKFLIALRQGRLYSVDIDHGGTGTIRKIDQIDVSPPTWPHDAWYDELLVSGNTLLVIGYSYEEDASELAFFTLDSEGKLDYRKTYLIDSTDYYSHNNYAGRLVNGNLVLYLEDYAYQDFDEEKQLKRFIPNVRQVNKYGKVINRHPLFHEHTIYRPVQHSTDPSLFTAAICPLTLERFSCSARSIMVDWVREHYVSENALYMWGTSYGWALDIFKAPLWKIHAAMERGEYEELTEEPVSVLYRFPLRQETVTAVEVEGEPIDQFSFSEQNGHLYFLTLREDGPIHEEDEKTACDEEDEDDPGCEEDGSKEPEYGSEGGGAFWAGIPLSLFSKSIPLLPELAYHRLPLPRDGSANRFIGDKLVYATEAEYGKYSSGVTVAALREPMVAPVIHSGFEILQIEPIGQHALLIGEKDDATIFSTLALSQNPAIAGSITRPFSELAESRSHGFNYKELNGSGLFGIPLYIEPETASKIENGQRYRALPVIDMEYYGVADGLSLYEMGSLRGDRKIQWEDNNCNTSCYDWYGSSRPFFIGNRIFALLKNEMVEGYISSHSIHEKQRINIFDDEPAN